MTQGSDPTDIGELARRELAALHEAHEELQARNQEAWANYCKRVDSILADVRGEGAEPPLTVTDLGREAIDAVRGRLDDARVQLHLGIADAHDLAVEAVDAVRDRLLRARHLIP